MLIQKEFPVAGLGGAPDGVRHDVRLLGHGGLALRDNGTETPVFVEFSLNGFL